MHLRDLQAASFRGVRFYCPKDDLEEGRTAIDHRYPDASYRYAEDNGRIPPEFKISALLFGRNVAGQVRALRSALNRPGPGTLKHPWAGSQFVQVKGPFKVSREDSDSGVVKFDITFLVTGPPIFPGLVSGIPAVVSGLVGSMIATLFEGFAGVYGTGGSTAASRSSIGGAISDVGSALVAAFGPDTSAEMLAATGPQIADTPSRTAVLLADAFRVPFQNDAVSNDQLVTGFRDVIETGRVITDTSLATNPTTLDLAARQVALSVLGAAVEGAGFASLAEAMVSRSYATAEDVEAAEAELVERFAAVQEIDLPGDTHDALADIMTATSEVLQRLEVRLPRLAVLDLDVIPASVLAYTLYADDANQWALINLNREMCPSLLAGAVSVLAAE